MDCEGLVAPGAKTSKSGELPPLTYSVTYKLFAASRVISYGPYSDEEGRRTPVAPVLRL